MLVKHHTIVGGGIEGGSVMKKYSNREISILFFIIFLTCGLGLIGQSSKAVPENWTALRGSKTVRVILIPVTGSASHVRFPVTTTVKKLLTPAGLSYATSGGDLLFRVNISARPKSRRYSRFGVGFGQTRYSGASVSGHIKVEKGGQLVIKRYYSGTIHPPHSIYGNSYKTSKSSPYSKAFKKSSFIQKVMEILVGMSDQKLAILKRYYRSTDIVIRKAAIEQMGALQDGSVRALLHKALDDKSYEIRLAAVNGLKKQADPGSFDPLLKRVTDPNSRVRSAVRSTLFKIDRNWRQSERCKSMIPTWLAELNAKSSLKQGAAVEALEQVNDPRVVKPMMMALSKSYTVRKKIVKLLDRKYRGWRQGSHAEDVKNHFLSILNRGAKKEKNGAVQALGELYDGAVEKQLIHTATGDPESSVRSSAMTVLTRKNKEWGQTEMAAKQVPFLIRDLSSPVANLRYQAVKALDRIDDSRAVPGLINALKDRDSRVRRAAMAALKDVNDPRIIKMLAIMLKSHDTKKREQAITALGKQDDPKAIELLIRASKDSKYSVRVKAIKALANKPGTQLNQVFLDALNDSNYQVKQAAISAIGKRKDARFVKPLVALLNSSNSKLRSSAAYALKGLVKFCSETELLTLVKSDHRSLKLATLSALGQYDSPEAIESLAEAATDKSSTVRLKAVEALVKIEDERTVRPLIVALKDSYYKIRDTAIKGLGRRQETAAIPALFDLLEAQKSEKKTSRYSRKRRYSSRRSSVTISILDALTRIGGELPADRILVQLRKMDYKTKYTWKTLAIKTTDPKAADLFVPALSESNSGFVRFMIEILGSRKERAAVEPLIEKLKSKDRGIKRTAHTALESITGQRIKAKYKKWRKWWEKNKWM